MTGRATLVVCLGAAAICLGACRERNEAHAAESKPPAPVASAPGVAISKEAQARAGMRLEVLRRRAVQPQLTAFGRIEEDPSAAFVLRAPVPGTLRASRRHDWPALGDSLPAGTIIGEIEPRLAPADRIGLTTQLATARSDVTAADAAVEASRAEYERLRALNADEKNVSDKAVQEAQARFAADRARAVAANERLGVIESSLESGGPAAARPLTVDRSGDVAEVFAQPGEFIEQNSPVVRLARFDRLLARIDLPLGERAPTNRSAEIVPVGFEDRGPIAATRIAVVATVDPRAQGVSLLYRLNKTFLGLRPGTACTAHLPMQGGAREGAFIPAAAVVQQNGRFWVYVQTAEGRFARREVALDLPVEGGFLAAGDFSPGERVVVTGAQILLSEEFKSQNNTE